MAYLWNRRIGLSAGIALCFLLLSGGVLAQEPVVTDEPIRLVLIEEYRDFIRSGIDPYRPDAGFGRSGFKKILYAQAVAARGNDIFVADIAQRSLFLIDRMQRTLTEFAILPGGGPVNLYLATDYSLYVIDGLHRQITQYARDGRIIKVFSNRFDLVNPVDMAESAESGQLLIADAGRVHVAVFNSVGVMTDILGRGSNIAGSPADIAALAVDHDNIYLLNRLTPEVRVADLAGVMIYAVGQGQLKQPVAIALDPCQRLYVADQFDNAIHIFLQDQPVATRVNQSPGLTGFQLITDIWIDNELLYAADGPTGNIKVFHIEGSCE